MALSTYSPRLELLWLKVFSLVRPATGITGSWSVLISPEELATRASCWTHLSSFCTGRFRCHDTKNACSYSRYTVHGCSCALAISPDYRGFNVQKLQKPLPKPAGGSEERTVEDFKEPSLREGREIAVFVWPRRHWPVFQLHAVGGRGELWFEALDDNRPVDHLHVVPGMA